MCEIKRLRILKNRQQQILEQFNVQDPLKLLPENYVSETGLTYSDITEKIEKINECASIIELRDSYVQTKDNTFEQVMKIAAANFCKQHTICPVCADRMQSRRRARYADPIRAQAEMVESGKRFAYMVTHTVKDGDSLSERLEHLKESKKAFRKMGQRRKSKRSRGECGKIKAGVATIEIKRGKRSGLWHVHSHDLIFTDQPLDYQVYDRDKKRKLDQKYGRHIPADLLKDAALKKTIFAGSVVPCSKISDEWLRATGGDSMSISVEPIRHVPRSATGKKKRMFKKMTFVESVSYQAKEVLKYISKVNPADVSDSLMILNETYNKRMVATYGQFRGVTGDDYNDAEEKEKESFVMLWKDGKYGEAMPGRVRDLEGEEATETRSKVGKVLGEYRRQRRYYIDAHRSGEPVPVCTVDGKTVFETIGDELSIILDDLKQQFRKRVSGIWSKYRNEKKAAEQLENAKCDKYSPVLALQGYYLPGSDRRDLYQMAFQ